ncbi:MAG: helix-turn-helix domain-containing protein [Bacteroidales bacterium]
MSLFLIVLLGGKKNKMLADKILLVMLAVYAITIGGPYIEIYNRNNSYPYPHLMNNAWLFLLLHGPLLWFYVKSLIIKNYQFRFFHFLHFLPFFVLLVLHYFNFLSLTANEKILLTQDELFTTTVFFKIRGIFIGLSSIGYNIWALILLRKHRKNIMNQFSTIENIDLAWLRTLSLASLIVFTVNVFLFNLNNYLHFAGFYELAQIAYSFSTIYVLFIGYFGIKQGRIFVDYSNTEVEQFLETGKKEKLILTEKKDYSDIINKLTLLMEQKQPYLDPELNLAKLSSLMKTKPELISEVLNSSLNQNFFDYINKYRIEEFKIKCLTKESKHFSVMGIAYDCGFNSKAAFYRAFNKFEGMSPTAYISKVS